MVVACCGDTWKLELHADDGEFWLTRVDDDDDQLDNVYGSPVDFMNKLEHVRPAYLSEPAHEIIFNLASDLWIAGEREFERALHNGWACIMARPTSPTSPFSVIPPDVLSAFTISLRDDYADPDDRVSDATGLDGAKLYSVFVAPKLNSIALARKSTSGAEEKCYRWLANEMKKLPQDPPKTHDEFKMVATKQFEGLSGAGFERVWKRALRDTGATWNAPGRRRKNPKSQTSR
ncbi:hypothetical protein DC522_32605 [Microvirga sp. KLBC 81]|nr:hypothetical protein DC522_32605 [Microvirga sp. KLBC 81]